MELHGELQSIKALALHDPEGALSKYEALLAQQKAEDQVGQVCYHYGVFLHSYGEEEMALELFQKAFASGCEKENIIKILDTDFWLPNMVEFQENYQLQTAKLKEKHPQIEILPFEDLPIRYYPVSDTSFLVYDINADEFQGWISLEEECLSKQLMEKDVVSYSVIRDFGTSNHQEILTYCYQHKSCEIYLLPDDYPEFMTLYMIPDVFEKALGGAVIFQTTGEAVQYFARSEHYLPKIDLIHNPETRKQLEHHLGIEHQRRLDVEKNMWPKPLLTIGIPTWNRGKRALQLVKELLAQDYDYEIEILISNNGSDKEIAEYEEICSFTDPRVTYTAFKENRYYYGNVAQVARLFRGKWLLLLGDEDYIDFSYFDAYLEKLLQYGDTVSVIRPGSTRMYADCEEKYARKGKDALSQFWLKNNYLSGVTYNRRFLTGALVNELEDKFANNIAYQYYTHMIYDCYMCIKGDIFILPDLLIIEGDPVEENASASYGYNTFESRMEQWKGYVDFINEMCDIADEEKVYAFLLACSKTAGLIKSRKEYYTEELEAWDVWCQKVKDDFTRGYEGLVIYSQCKNESRDLVHYNIEVFYDVLMK